MSRIEDPASHEGAAGEASAPPGPADDKARPAAGLKMRLADVAVKNLCANPIRALILGLIMAAQTACLLTGVAMGVGIRTELNLAEQRLGADILVYPNAGILQLDDTKLIMQGTPTPCIRARSSLDRLSQAEGIAAIGYQTYLLDPTRAAAPTSQDRFTDEGSSWVVGYDPDTDFTIGPWIDEGPTTRVATGDVIVGSDVQVSAVGTVTVFGVERTVGAHLADTGSMLDSAIFVDEATLALVLADARAAGVTDYRDVDAARDFSVATVNVQADYDRRAVADWINLYVRKTTAIPADEGLADLAGQIGSHTGVIVGVIAFVWIILLAALFIAQSMLMRERRHEIFVWHAIGASRRIISRVLMREAVIVHIVGATAAAVIVGIILALGGGALLPGGAPSVPSTFIMALAAVVAAVLIGAVGTWGAIRRIMRALDGQMLVTV